MAGDEEVLQFQYYLIVYLDLLGQREVLRKITSIPTNPVEKREFLQQMKDSLGKVLNVRQWFQEYIEAVRSYEVMDPTQVPENMQEEFKASLKTNIEFYILSDSLIIAVPLMGEDQNCAALNSVHAAFLATCGVGALALSGGIPLRAGIEVGVGTRIPETGEVYGPVLQRAFDLESKLAEYPRFLVGQGALQYLRSVAMQRPETRLGIVTIEQAKKCLTMITQDSDGRLMLDFFGPTVRDSFDGSLTREDFDRAFSFVQEQYREFVQQNDEKLSSRYDRLLAYLRRRKANWLNTN